MMHGPKPPPLGQVAIINGDRVESIDRGSDKHGHPYAPLYRVGPPGLTVLKSTSWEAIRHLRWGWVATTVGGQAIVAALHASRFGRQVYDRSATEHQLDLGIMGIGEDAAGVEPAPPHASRTVADHGSDVFRVPRGIAPPRCLRGCWSAVFPIDEELHIVERWAIVGNWDVALHLEGGRVIVVRPDGTIRPERQSLTVAQVRTIALQPPSPEPQPEPPSGQMSLF